MSSELNVERVEESVRRFGEGCACSQAVFSAYCERFGIDAVTGMRIAAGFGGGMRMAETCGAVTGAIMALGLFTSGEDSGTPEGRAETNDAVKRFLQSFRGKHGSTCCRDLLGCDISTDEGRAYAQENDLIRRRCPEFVRSAAQSLEQTLRGDDATGAFRVCAL